MMRYDLDLPGPRGPLSPLRQRPCDASPGDRARSDSSNDLPRGAIIAGSVCAVTLVERGSGRPLRINGSRVTIYTRSPDAAVQDLMTGRDPLIWAARIVPLDPAGRQT